jgi:hypothetical protein
MFGKIIDKIEIDGFDNYGVVFEKDGRYYKEKSLDEVGIEDGRKNYFFAIKKEVEFEQLSCDINKLNQDYTFKFVTQCSYSSWIIRQFLNVKLEDIESISNAKFTIGVFNEEYIRTNLIVNTIEFNFFGHFNNCEIEKPCCC